MSNIFAYSELGLTEESAGKMKARPNRTLEQIYLSIILLNTAVLRFLITTTHHR